MTTYNFTVRAEDETGAFADREFSIQVRNNLVDRLLAIDATNAYSSIDGTTWTTRAGKGGSWCDNILGKWIVVQNATTYRISEDTINWQENLQFRLKNDPPVYSEDETDPETGEPVVVEEAGELYDLPFTIQFKGIDVIGSEIYAVARIGTKIGVVRTADLVNWYLIVGTGYNVTSNNYFGVEGITNEIGGLSNIEKFNNMYVIKDALNKRFIVSSDLVNFTTLIPNNASVFLGGSSTRSRNTIKNINGVLLITVAFHVVSFSSSSPSYLRRYYTNDLVNINIPTGYSLVSGNSRATFNIAKPIYVNGSYITPTQQYIVRSEAFPTHSVANTVYSDLEVYKGSIFAIHAAALQQVDIDTLAPSIPTTNGLPTSGLVSIAAL